MWVGGFDYRYRANVSAACKDGNDKRGYDEDGNRIPVVKVDPEEDEAYDARLRKVSKSLKNVAPPGDFFVHGERTVFPLPVMNVVGLGDLVAPATEALMKELIAKCKLAPTAMERRHCSTCQIPRGRPSPTTRSCRRFGDCPHEVKPVTKGYRLCLTYNLVNVTVSESAPRFGGNHPLYAKLKDSLCEFFTEEQASQSKSRRLDADGTKETCGFDITKPKTHRQCKFVYVLDYKYTKAGLSFRYLKNKDALVADCLARFCEESNGAFELYLCKAKYSFSWRGDETTMYDSDLSEDEQTGKLEKELNLPSPWVPRGHEEAPIKVAAKSSWKKVQGDLTSEVAPAGLFDRKSFKFDGQNAQLYTGNEGACLDKWYKSAALVVVPALVAMQVQLYASPQTFFDRWVSLWSLTNETGVKVLEAAQKLHSLDLVRCVVTSTRSVIFQPTLLELVAPFGTEAVAAMCKSICESSLETNEYRETSGGVQKLLYLVTSLLGDVKDAKVIASVLDAVRVEAKHMANCNIHNYARVLLMASRVLVDRAKSLLLHKNLDHFVKTAVPAIRTMATSCNSEDWETVEKIVSFAIDQLTVSEPAIKKLAYTNVHARCDGCRFYYCPCGPLNDFFESSADSKTFSASEVNALQSLKLGKLLKIEPENTNSSSVLVTKTYESSLMLKLRDEREALREILAKHTA